uniref:Reverse transcriptase zinc-binding domain-containing protein n=1 Tax=Davidia involucrata TaxID=16924 RepID=A0A5B7B4Q6_DAVIN
MVSDYGCWDRGEMIWDPRLRRDLRDWEIAEVINLLGHLSSLRLVAGHVDALVWKVDHSRGFSVRSFFKELTAKGDCSFPWIAIWKSKAPLKVNFFVWLVAWDAVLTTHKFQRRDFMLANRCYV